MEDSSNHRKVPTAKLLGSGVHSSLLLHRAAALGLEHGEDFAAAAVRRGCRYYAPPGPAPQPVASAARISNEDLAICLLHPSLPHDPQRIRLGAAMLAAAGNDPRRLAHRSVQERAERIVATIARAGLRYEPENSFWRELLEALPACAPIPDGILPHPSRYVALAGRTGPQRDKNLSAQWIRPVKPAA